MRNEGIRSQDLRYQATYEKAYRTRDVAYKRLQAIIRITFTVVVLLSITALGGYVTYFTAIQRNDATVVHAGYILPEESENSDHSRSNKISSQNAEYPVEEISEEAPIQIASVTSSIYTTKQRTNMESTRESFYEDDIPSVSNNEIENIQEIKEVEEPIPEPLPPLPQATPNAGTTDLTPDQLAFVEKVVEAEVTGTTYTYQGVPVTEDEMLLCKLRVAQVFLNRARDTTKFAHVDNIYEATAAPGASSTVSTGRYNRVRVTDLTRQAVQMALDPNQPDLTNGALFFLAFGAKSNPYGSYLFTDAVGHSFFR